MIVNWNAVAAIAEVIAAAGVIGSLVYLALQVRQNTAQAKAAVRRATVNELGRTLESLASSADLASVYVRGLQDYDVLTVEERARFSSFLMHLFKLFEEVYALYRSGDLDDVEWQGIENALSSIAAYPGTRSWWSTRSSWLHPEFAKFVGAKAIEGERPAIYKEHS